MLSFNFLNTLWINLKTDFSTHLTNVIMDFFQFKKPTWQKTVLKYTTDKAVRLPIVDVAIRDVGEDNQAFWIEIGKACYY